MPWQMTEPRVDVRVYIQVMYLYATLLWTVIDRARPTVKENKLRAENEGDMTLYLFTALST